MVEALKPHVQPAYGGLPTATEESLEAQRQLRAEARRKRRRSRRIAWGVLVLFLGGICVAGWLAYRAYRDDQDRQAAAREVSAAAGDDAEGGVAPGALTGLGNQQELIEAMEDINSIGVTPSGGGLSDIVDQARDVVDRAPPGPIVRSVTFAYRRYDGAAPDARFDDYSYTYDLVADDYVADIRRSDAPGLTIFSFAGDWRFAIHPDGVVERVPRSAASLDPTPDIALASFVATEHVVPAEAEPFADEVPLDDPSQSGFIVDTEAWQRADPDGYGAWVARWNHPGPDAPSLVEAQGRQVAREPLDLDPGGGAPTDYGALELERTEPGAAVTFGTDEAGRVVFVFIIDPYSDFRAVYELHDAGPDGAGFDVGDRDWVDAP